MLNAYQWKVFAADGALIGGTRYPQDAAALLLARRDGAVVRMACRIVARRNDYGEATYPEITKAAMNMVATAEQHAKESFAKHHSPHPMQEA